MTHPYETLADYAEGTADEREQAQVEAHLASCAECRSDLASARAGLAAARRLPDVETPPIVATLDLDGSGAPQSEDTESAQGGGVLVGRWQAGPRTARHKVVPGREPKPSPTAAEPRRPGRWGAIAAGLAVAAAAAAIFVGAIRGGGGDTTNVRAGDSLEAAPEASLIESNHNYTGDELAALATRYVSSSAALSGGATSTEGAAPQVPAATAPPDTPVSASPAPNPSPSRTLNGGATDQDPRACIDLGSGVTADLQLLYLEAARYEGQDAYIGVFGTQNSSGNPVALVVAVTRTDCSPLYFGRQTG